MDDASKAQKPAWKERDEKEVTAMCLSALWPCELKRLGFRRSSGGWAIGHLPEMRLGCDSLGRWWIRGTDDREEGNSGESGVIEVPRPKNVHQLMALMYGLGLSSALLCYYPEDRTPLLGVRHADQD